MRAIRLMHTAPCWCCCCAYRSLHANPITAAACPAGPAIVFSCHWSAVPAYLLAELLGGVLGSLISWPLYGTGLQLGK